MKLHDIWRYRDIKGKFDQEIATRLAGKLIEIVPELAQGKRSQKLVLSETLDLIETLITEFQKAQEESKSLLKGKAADIHNWVVLSLERGRDTLGWSCEAPPRTFFYVPPKSIAFDFDFQLLARVRRLDGWFFETLASDLADVATAKNLGITRVAMGQVLYGAMRFGGVLSQNKLESLLTTFGSPVFAFGRRAAVQLFQKKRAAEIWFPDPLTENLLLRFIREHPAPYEFDFTPAEAVEAFRCAVSPENEPKINFNALLKGARLAYSLSTSPLMVRYAQGQIQTASLSPSRFAAMFREELNDVPRQQKLTEEEKEMAENKEEGNKAASVSVPILRSPPKTDRSHVTTKRLTQLFRDLRNCIDVSEAPGWRDRAGKNLDDFVEEHCDEIGVINIVFVHYVKEMVAKTIEAHDRHKRASTPRKYIGYFGPLFFVAAAEMSKRDIGREETWIELYEELVSRKPQKSKSKTVKELQLFHDFMVRGWTLGVPDIDLHERFPNLVEPRQLHAAYLTVSEMRAAQTALRGMSDSNFAQQLEALLLILYWCGLRINEATTLLCCDLDWIAGRQRGDAINASLVVRCNKFGTVKTTTGNRTLNLAALMPADDLKTILAYMQQRQAGFGCSDEEFRRRVDPLFPGVSGKPIADAVVRQFLIPLLREASGDSSIIVHDLRHTAACNLMLALHECDEPRSALLNSLDGGTCLKEVGQGLVDHNIAMPKDRRMVWVVSHILGHSSAEETMASYTHVFPLLAAEVPRRDANFYVGANENGAVHLKLSQQLMSEFSGLSVGRASHVFTSKTAPTQFEKLKLASQYSIKEADDSRIVRAAAREVPALKAPEVIAPVPTPRDLHIIASQSKNGADVEAVALGTGWAKDFCNKLVEVMMWSAALPSNKESKHLRTDKIVEGKKVERRFGGVRKRFLTGAGDKDTKELGAYQEVPGYLASYPRLARDNELLDKSWKRAALTLRSTELWRGDFLKGDDWSSNSRLPVKERSVLFRELTAYLACVNSTSHAFKLYEVTRSYSEEDAIDVLRFILRVVHPDSVRVIWTPGAGAEDCSTKQLLGRFEGLPRLNVIRQSTKRFSDKKWPLGTWYVRLVDPNTNVDDAGKTVYGLWYAVYMFFLLVVALDAQLFKDLRR